MKDGILKETKNSRLLKAELPATYAELVALAAGAGIPADVLFNAEGWQQLPTFLNKKNLLQDSTAGLLGLTGDPTVDDAFVALLLTVKQMALVRVAVTVAGSPAIADIEVTGLEGLDGGAVYTDASGEAVGFAPAGEVSISTPTYQDLPAAPTVTRELAAGEIVDVSLAIGSAPQAGDKSVTSTTSGIRFSPYVTGVDVCCVGGGGSGAAAFVEGLDRKGGGGGAGGQVVNRLGVTPDTRTDYKAVVGSRGPGLNLSPGTSDVSGNRGGDSSFMGVTAYGGGGGVGSNGGSGTFSGGNGGNGYNIAAQDGAANTGTRAFNDPDGELYSGGGGGAGTWSNGQGGSPNGGDGESRDNGRGQDARGTGGGGGGAIRGRGGSNAISGDGYQGLVRFRWRVA